MGFITKVIALVAVGLSWGLVRGTGDEDAKAPATPPEPLPPGAVARLGTTHLRTTATSLVLAADGRTLLTETGGRTLSRWDPETGCLRTETPLPGEGPARSWFSPDGRLLAVCETDALALWDTATAKRHGLLSVKSRELLHVAFSSDGQIVATAEGSESKYRVRLWDGAGKERLVIELPSYANSLTFDPEGKRLFAAVDNHSLRCWDLATARQLWQNDHWASHVVIAPDGRTLCTDTYQQGPLHLWDAATGRKRSTFDSERCWTGQLAFSPDGQTVAQATSKGVFLWDAQTRKLRHHCGEAGPLVVFAADGRSLFTLRHLLQRWDVATGKPLYPDTHAEGHIGPVLTVAFVPDGQSMATCGVDGTVRIWKWADGRQRLLRIKTADRGSWVPSGGMPLAFTPDGRLFVTQDEETLALFETDTGRKVRRFLLPPKIDCTVQVVAGRLTADGRTLLALGTTHTQPRSTIVFEQEEPLCGWDVATGRQVLKQSLLCGAIGGAAFSPEGRFVIRRQFTELHDVRTGMVRPLVNEPYHLEPPFAFSLDGRLLATAEPGEDWGLAQSICLYEVLTGRRLTRIKTPLGVCREFAFSPDGRLLAAPGTDALHVWETATGRRFLHLPARGRLTNWTASRFAECLAFAPDGRTLATGHADGTALLWDLTPAWKNLSMPSGPVDTAACWTDLAAADPRTGSKAMEGLASDSTAALPLLRQRLRPEKIETHWLRNRLADLDSDVFEKREAATRDLKRVVETVEADLQQAQTKTTSAEVRLRLAEILEAPRPAVPPPEALRSLRAVAVLERIGSEQARALLKTLAEGSPGAQLTREAKGALERLAQKHAYPNPGKRTPHGKTGS